MNKPVNSEYHLNKAINEAIVFFINQKQNKFNNSLSKDYEIILRDENILWTNEKNQNYYLNFNSDKFNKNLLSYIEKELEEKLPNEIIEAFQFLQRFFDKLKKLKPRHLWYIRMEREVQIFVIKRFHTFLSENIDFIRKVIDFEDYPENPFSPLKQIQSNISKVIPFIELTPNEYFELAFKYFEKPYYDNNGYEILESVCKRDEKKGKRLLEICISKISEENFKKSLVSILSGFSSHDADRAIKIIEDLLGDSLNEVEVLRAIGWVHCINLNQVKKVLSLVKIHKTTNPEFIRLKPRILQRIFQFELSDEEIQMEIINSFSDLIKQSEDKLILKEIAYWIGYLEGYEEEKTKLLYKLIGREKGIAIDFDKYFRKYKNPKFLFGLIQQFYTQFRLKATIETFKSALSHFERTNLKDFEKCILELLSHNLGIIRKAGFDIIVGKRYGNYKLDVLSLNEIKQQIVIDTILSIPTFIEKTLPIILPIRNSSHESVRELFKNNLFTLIIAYEKEFITLLKKELSLNLKNDKALFKTIEAFWSDYKKHLDLKRSVTELNPLINQRTLVNQFFREEQEKMVESMETANQESEMIKFGLAKNIRIIRGCGFSSELNPNISRLGKVESKILMDKRYYMNPEYYEYAYKISVFEKNYQFKP